MIRRGDILYDPVNKETITFIQTSADTAGMLLQMQISMAPGKNPYYAGMHMHPKQEERLTIKSGQILVTMAGDTKCYKTGDCLIIPAGTPHKIANISTKEELNFICEITPALHTEILYETALAFCRSRNLTARQRFPLLQVTATLNKYMNHVYLSLLPVWLQKCILRLLAPLALLLGYQAELNYKKVVSEKRLVFF